MSARLIKGLLVWPNNFANTYSSIQFLHHKMSSSRLLWSHRCHHCIVRYFLHTRLNMHTSHKQTSLVLIDWTDRLRLNAFQTSKSRGALTLSLCRRTSTLLIIIQIPSWQKRLVGSTQVFLFSVPVHLRRMH